MTQANRGKLAESKLTATFKQLDAASSTFTFDRIHDAHSSLGAMSSPRPGDFMLFCKGKNYLIEVKQVAHAYRLPCTNFELAQRARMRKRQMAGSICWVVVYHSTTDRWRLLPLSHFGVETTGSWDFRGLPELTLKELVPKLIEESV